MSRREKVQACRRAQHALDVFVVPVTRRHDLIRVTCPTCEVLITDNVIKDATDEKRAAAIAQYKSRYKAS